MSTTGFVLTALLASSLATLCGLATLSKHPPKKWRDTLGMLLIFCSFVGILVLDADVQFADFPEYKFTRVFVITVFAQILIVKWIEWRLKFPRCFTGEEVTTRIFAAPMAVVALCVIVGVFAG